MNMKLFLVSVLFVLAGLSIANAQFNDIDTCYSADCENGLDALNNNFSTVDVFMEVESIGLDGNFLLEVETPDPDKIQCVSTCAQSVKKSHMECLEGVSTTMTDDGSNSLDTDFRLTLKEVCEATTKKKFQECRVKNDCALFGY